MSSERYPAYTTRLDYTITGYYFPTTTEYRTLTARSTPILVFRLLPASAGGGLLLADNRSVEHNGMLKQMGNVFLMDNTDDLGANVIFTETTGIKTVTVLSMNVPTLPFSVVTTPAASRSSVTAGGTGTDTNGLNASDPGSRKSPKLNSGAIAGISIAVISGVLLMIGAWILFRRGQKARDTSRQSDVLSFKKASDKMVVSSRDGIEPNSSYHLYNPGPRETPCMQGVAPPGPRGPVASAYELRADTRTNEQSPRSPVEISPLSPIEYSLHRESAPNIEIAVVDASPHIEAQRKRELDWLEMEEAKLRQRREQLMQQAEEHRLSSEIVG